MRTTTRMLALVAVPALTVTACGLFGDKTTERLTNVANDFATADRKSVV